MQRNHPTLDLSDCFIGDSGCQKVARFIQENPQISALELRGNNINGPGITILAGAIQTAPNLKHLSLEWNNLGISDAGLQAFFDVLSDNPSISAVDLRNNKIGADACNAIADMLKSNNNIHSLDLRWNEIGNQGAKALISGLQRNKTLGTLELSGNKISENIIDLIQSMLIKNGGGIMTRSRVASPQRASIEVPTRSYARSSKFGPGETNFLRQFPMDIIEKEKDFAEEMRSRYEVQAAANNRAEIKITDLEREQDQERLRFKEAKTQLTRELEEERIRRQTADDNNTKFRDDLARLEIDSAKNIQDLELRLESMTQERNYLNTEANKYKELIESQEKNYREKIQVLEERLTLQLRTHMQQDESSKNSLDRAKRESQNERKEITKTWETKYKNLEDSLNTYKKSNEELQHELQGLRKENLDLRLEHEQSLHELEKKVKDDECRRFESTIRTLEQKVSTLELTRAQIQKKNNDTINELQQTIKDHNDEIMRYEKLLSNHQVQISTHQKEANLATAKSEKLQTELLLKNSLVEKLEEEKRDLNQILTKKKESEKNQVERLLSEHASEKRSFESLKENLNRRISELERQVREYQYEVGRMKQDQAKLSESLSISINRTIMGAFEDLRKNNDGPKFE